MLKFNEISRLKNFKDLKIDTSNSEPIVNLITKSGKQIKLIFDKLTNGILKSSTVTKPNGKIAALKHYNINCGNLEIRSFYNQGKNKRLETTIRRAFSNPKKIVTVSRTISTNFNI